MSYISIIVVDYRVLAADVSRACRRSKVEFRELFPYILLSFSRISSKAISKDRRPRRREVGRSALQSREEVGNTPIQRRSNLVFSDAEFLDRVSAAALHRRRLRGPDV